jgi:hypothetical protein
MAKHKLVLLAACIGLCLLAGCTATQPYEAVEKISATDVDKPQAMQIAENVLIDMHFVIEKADADRGLIRTQPLSAAQFFEIWRSDNVGAFNTTEANLHSIRRVAEVTFWQEGGRLCIGCDVQVQRLNLPEREVSSSAHAYQMFSKSTPAMQRLAVDPAQEREMVWIESGKDTRLATEILRSIEKCLQQG